MSGLAQSHNWLIHRIVGPALRERIEKYATGGLLDVGCGTKPYEEMARPFVSEHVGVDRDQSIYDSSRVDLRGTAYEVPVETESFDTVLCTYVLEHVEEPSRALAETFRVLRAGGHAVYTVPLFWHLHEDPRDFYRYTRYGLAYLFEQAGFEIVEIHPLTGFCVTFTQELVYWLEGARRGGKRNPLWWLVPPLGWVLQAMAYAIHKIDASARFTAEYLVVARKPERDHGGAAAL